MLKFVLCIFALLLVAFPFAISADAGISLSSLTPPIPLKAQNTTYSYLLSSDTNSSIRVTYFADGNAVAFQFFDLVENTPSAFSRLHSFPSAGLHSFVASISDYNFSDSNASNNSANWVGNVANGTDLYAQDISVQPTIFLPNTNVIIRAYVKNIGDVNLSSSFNVSFYYDGNLFFVSTITGLDANQTKETNAPYVLPSNFSGSHSFSYQVDLANIIPEGDEGNNGKSIVVYDSSEADLVFDANSLVFSTESPRVNDTFTVSFSVRNSGGKTASNVLVNAYHSSIATTNQIWTTTISSILPYEKQDLSFTYTPHAIGVDKIIVYIDPNNSIVEQNNENNLADKNFNIGITDQNQLAGLPLILDLYPECDYYITDENGNVDHLVSGALYDANTSTDVNNMTTEKRLNFTYVNFFGQIIYDNYLNAATTKQIPENGMTLKTIIFGDGYVKVLFIFQKPRILTKSECIADQKTLSEKYNKLQTDYANLYAECEVDKKQYLDCDSQLGTYKTNLDSCNTSQAAKNTEYTTLMSSYNTQEEDCQNRITGQVDMQQVQCNYRVDLAVKDVNTLQNKIDTSGFENNIYLAIIFCFIAGLGITFFISERNKGKF